MIISKLKVKLAEKNLKISRVYNDTKISRSTLTALADNQTKGIQYDTLNKLCQYLRLQPEDLFSYTPYDFDINVDIIKVKNAKDFYLSDDFSKKYIGYGDIELSLFINVSDIKNQFSIEFSGAGILRDDLINIDIWPTQSEDTTVITLFFEIYNDLSIELKTYVLKNIGTALSEYMKKTTVPVIGSNETDLYIPILNSINVELLKTDPSVKALL